MLVGGEILVGLSPPLGDIGIFGYTIVRRVYPAPME
jgi:hypothetical protein